MSEQRPYASRPWIVAYCLGLALWVGIAVLFGAAGVIAVFAFGVLCAAAAARGLEAGGNE